MENTIEKYISEILKLLGEDVNRDGLKNTPMRFAKAMVEIFTPKEFNFTTFPAEEMDEMIIVRNINFYSICEHHLLPFFGTGVIAYIPNTKIVGLSKLPRVLEYFSAGAQNQERITSNVAEFIEQKLNPKGVAVSLTAQHLCMSMRGVKQSITTTTTNKLLGAFHLEGKARAEFFQSL